MGSRRTVGALTGAVALVLALVACGAGEPGVDLGALRSTFMGSWELESATVGDVDVSGEDLDGMEELGMRVTLDLDGEGHMLLDVFGEQYEGAWEMQDEKTLALTVDGDSLEVPYEDGILSLAMDVGSLRFGKASDTPVMDRVPGENSGLLADSDSPIDFDDLMDLYADDEPTTVDDLPGGSALTDVYTESVERVAPLDVTVADDEHVAVRVTGVGVDYEGDTGYFVLVENRTDEEIFAMNVGATVDGEQIEDEHATFACTVAPGEATETFFFFDHEVVTVSEGSSCTTDIVVADADFLPLGMYEMSV